jgi:DNA helicase-2/ATP-dependent DNA helicase PcrA
VYIQQMNHLEGLNDAQKRAVEKTGGAVSVLAGAGSGKTRVLTTRIYHLIKSGVPAERILAVTFTNKAAREMRERLMKLLHGGRVPFVATFHGLGRELLESYGSALGVPKHFTIFDRDDSQKAIAKALKELDVDTKELSPRNVLSRISKAKGEGKTAQSFYETDSRKSFGSRTTAEAWLRYEKALKEAKALDFDDLITLPVRMLREHADIRALARARWDYIHIDEYQDTNALQGELANMLASGHGNLFVVGDIDQTIYTWRGATIDNLLEFDKDYPEAETIVLEQNYRSTGTIVAAANMVIEKNVNRKEKKSITENAAGEPITLHVADSAEDEAVWIAREVARTIERGAKPEEIAVLFRTNFQSRALEEAFLSAGIPYKLLGTGFFDRKEVKDVLAWIRLALEPAREADRMRAVQAPTRGIGKTTLAKLSAGKRSELRASDLAKVTAFENIVEELGTAAETASPSEFVRLVIEKSGMKNELEHGNEEEKERFENIQELATLASRHDGETGRDGVAAFLADAALAGDQDELDRVEGKTGVTLMTVHAAKGLEFDTVFVSGLEEGLFPHERDEEDDTEEERRLFYVAMTRAARKLVLTLARVRRIYGADFISEPSSFLRDIDSALIKYSGKEYIIEA